VCHVGSRCNTSLLVVASSEFPRFIPLPIRHHRTHPTPPDDERSESRLNLTPPDYSDGLLPPHNPSVVGSIPSRPTKSCVLQWLMVDNSPSTEPGRNNT